jgi:hypothetical protein
MKKIKKILTFIFLLMPVLSCYAQHQYEIFYQSETEESIQMSVIVYGVKKKVATDYACLDAVQALIFEGIKGSKRRQIPYVQDEQSSYNEHAAYYHDLFDNGGFRSFVIAASLIEQGKTPDKKNFYMVNVNIHYKSLKESLSNHNVIRRFGV